MLTEVGIFRHGFHPPPFIDSSRTNVVPCNLFVCRRDAIVAAIGVVVVVVYAAAVV